MVKVVFITASIVLNIILAGGWFAAEQYIRAIEPSSINCLAYTDKCETAINNLEYCEEANRNFKHMFDKFKGVKF